ncbi:MAG: hypothetical protein LBL28_01000 [Treponema sp.]|jgi:hypothetical protein|nr:hypothetical protein [Treponema sp.]
MKKTTARFNKKRMWSKKIMLLTAAGLCLFGGLGIFAVLRPVAVKTVDGKKPAGTVNGEPFFQEDIDVYAAELRAAVAADYGRRYKLLGMGARFWDTRYGNSTPGETLNELARKNLIRNMVLIQEARRRNIDTPASYHDLESERKDWNTPGDEIMYGPKQLGPAEYNSYRITGITNALKAALLTKELLPTETQLRAAYAGLSDDLKRAPYSASGVLFRWDSDGPSPEGEIRGALRKGNSPDKLVRGLAGSFPGLRQEDFEFDSATVSKEDAYQQDLARALENASRGAFIPGPQEQAELYYVTGKEGGGFLSFEEAPGLGRNKWINDQFELFLDKRVKAARVKIYK